MYGKNGFVLLRTSVVLPSVAFAVLALAACKQTTSLEQSESSSLGSSAASLETLTARESTTLKSSLLQSASLGTSETCPIPQGTILVADNLKAEGIDHWRIMGLIEVKLPTGEVGRVARQSNELPSNSGTFSAQPTATPVAQATAMPVVQPTATPVAQATATPASPSSGESSQAAVTVRTPAELLNCDLLKKDSFLVYAKHFSRALPQKSARADSASTRESAGGGDDGLFMWPTRGRTIRNDSGGAGYFGAPRGSGRGHQGIDIVAAVGEPVLAARSGTIVDPAYEFSYGKVVDVKHEEGFMTRYAHLTSFSYSHGAYVEKGDRIAAAGRTGNASGAGITPHLHFEVRQYNRLLNPVRFLP